MQKASNRQIDHPTGSGWLMLIPCFMKHWMSRPDPSKRTVSSSSFGRLPNPRDRCDRMEDEKMLISEIMATGGRRLCQSQVGFNSVFPKNKIPPHLAMGQNPNRAPSEHPNPTTEIGSKMGGELTYPKKWTPLVLTQPF